MTETQTEPHVCEHEDCESLDTMPVFMGPDDEPDGYYCGEHVAEAGFCRGCGQFCAGIESFDFGPFPGYCDNCADELRHEEALEAGEYDDDLDDESEWPFDDEDDYMPEIDYDE